MKNYWLIALVVLVAACDSEQHHQRLVKITADSRLFRGGPEGQTTFHYDQEGRVDRIANKQLYWDYSVTTHISYTENWQVITNEEMVATIALENGLPKQYALKINYMDEFLYDTLDFTFDEAGRLSTIHHAFANEDFSVECDSRGNITRIFSEEKSFSFKYDKNPNPFQGIPLARFATLYSESQGALHVRSIASYFSPNNNGFPYDGNAVYSYGINSYPVKIDSRDILYGDFTELEYEFVDLED